MYIYYQKSYEAHEHIGKRSRQGGPKRIIQRGSRARRERRRRRKHLAAALDRLIPVSGVTAGLSLGV